MPSSRFEHISDVISIVLAYNPTSVLDIGCGFGKWGFLMREFLDIFFERYDKSSWTARIDAVEVFQGYILPHHAYIYNNVYVMRAEEYLPVMPNYDVIYLGDVIEHMEKPTALHFLRSLQAKYNKALLMAVPIGRDWPQGEVLGNPFEAHLSSWTLKDITRCGACYVKPYRLSIGRNYALAVWAHDGCLSFNRSKSRRVLGVVRSLIGRTARGIAGRVLRGCGRRRDHPLRDRAH